MWITKLKVRWVKKLCVCVWERQIEWVCVCVCVCDISNEDKKFLFAKVDHTYVITNIVDYFSLCSHASPFTMDLRNKDPVLKTKSNSVQKSVSISSKVPCVSGIQTSLTRWFDFRLEPISVSDRAAPKIVNHFKSGQKWGTNNHIPTFPKVQSKSLKHSVCLLAICKNANTGQADRLKCKSSQIKTNFAEIRCLAAEKWGESCFVYFCTPFLPHSHSHILMQFSFFLFFSFSLTDLCYIFSISILSFNLSFSFTLFKFSLFLFSLFPLIFSLSLSVSLSYPNGILNRSLTIFLSLFLSFSLFKNSLL